MRFNTIGIFVVMTTSLIATVASAQTVTPEEVMNLPIGTKYTNGAAKVVRDGDGFTFHSTRGVGKCSNVGKAGGNGNAAINCVDDQKHEFRFEWIDINKGKAQYWWDMTKKAGQKENQPPQEEAILTRR